MVCCISQKPRFTLTSFISVFGNQPAVKNGARLAREQPTQPVSSNMPSPNKEAANFSCTQCRLKKLKCDRVRPHCGRCAKLSESCDYPQTRRSNVGRRKRVYELEAKLGSCTQVKFFMKAIHRSIHCCVNHHGSRNDLC